MRCVPPGGCGRRPAYERICDNKGWTVFSDGGCDESRGLERASAVRELARSVATRETHLLLAASIVKVIGGYEMLSWKTRGRKMDHGLIYLSVYENYSTARAIDDDSTRFSNMSMSPSPEMSELRCTVPSNTGSKQNRRRAQVATEVTEQLAAKNCEPLVQQVCLNFPVSFSFPLLTFLT